MDYLVPTAAEIPAIEIHHLETPSEFTETGAKGMGEGGTIGAPAGVATAVADARRAPRRRGRPLPIAPDACAALRAAPSAGSAPMSDVHLIALTVNGERHEVAVEARRTLADVLRHDLGYTGTHLGCEHGICGACTVLVDGEPTRACLVFGVQADDCEVATVEGLAGDGRAERRCSRRSEHHALQCGFCTPGVPDARDRAAAREPGADATRRSARRWRRTSAAAPATRRSSRRCAPPREQRRTPGPTRLHGRPASPLGPAREDDRLLRGAGRFVDDVTGPASCCPRVVRAPSRARAAVGVDTAAARDAARASSPRSPPPT